MARYTFKTRPRPHQARALKFLLRNRGGGLQVPMRYGKTKIAIDFSAAMHLLEDVRRVFVVAPIDGVYVWLNEIERHCPMPYLVTTGSPKEAEEYRTNMTTPWPDEWLWFHVINWEGLWHREPTGRGREWVAMERDDLAQFKPDIVVVDESHHAGNPTVIKHRFLYRITKAAPHVLVMTGTMFHRKPFYVFGQVKLYDVGIFGGEWGAFKKRIAIFGGFGNYEVKRYKNLGWMMKKIRPWCWIEKKVPLTPPVMNVIPAPLSGRNLDVYRKMEKDSIVDLGGEKATADIVLTRHLRLTQICGGWVRTTGGKYRRVGTCKLDMATSRLREYHEQDIHKAVIGVRFIKELVDLVKAGKKIGYNVIPFHGGLPKGPKRYRRIEIFQQTDKPTLFITQIAAAREAIDLSVASTMMLYSLTESYLDLSQFMARIETFNDKRTLQYDFIVSPGTRDEVSYLAMNEKKDVAEFIADDPERVERIVAANVDKKDAKREGNAR